MLLRLIPMRRDSSGLSSVSDPRQASVLGWWPAGGFIIPLQFAAIRRTCNMVQEVFQINQTDTKECRPLSSPIFVCWDYYHSGGWRALYVLRRAATPWYVVERSKAKLFPHLFLIKLKWYTYTPPPTSLLLLLIQFGFQIFSAREIRFFFLCAVAAIRSGFQKRPLHDANGGLIHFFFPPSEIRGSVFLQ